MSLTGFAASPAEFDDEERHTVAPPASPENPLHHHHHHRQGHYLKSPHGELLDGVDDTAIASVVDRTVDTENEKEQSAIVITAAQKMLSACTGSLLTSLLGESDRLGIPSSSSSPSPSPRLIKKKKKRKKKTKEQKLTCQSVPSKPSRCRSSSTAVSAVKYVEYAPRAYEYTRNLSSSPQTRPPPIPICLGPTPN